MELTVYMTGGFYRKLDLPPATTAKCAAKRAAEAFEFDPYAQPWMLLTENGEPVDDDEVMAERAGQTLELAIDCRPEGG